MQSYLEQKNPEEFQKDLPGQNLGSELVGNLQKNTKWYTWKKFKSCLRWILNYFSIWLIDGIAFEKFNTVAVRSSDHKNKERSKEQ